MPSFFESRSKIVIKQAFELAELFGYETRNKYRILDESGSEIGFVAEQQKGMLAFLFRQFLGHWRSFELHFFDSQRTTFLIARHPFRWFFQALIISDSTDRLLGRVERRFSLLTKRFDVYDAHDRLLMEVASPIWRIWTFPFRRRGQDVALVTKKWTGFGAELFTDKDTFLVEYKAADLNLDEKALVLGAALYIDLLFFETKAGQ